MRGDGGLDKDRREVGQYEKYLTGKIVRTWLLIKWDIEREVVKYVSQLGSKWEPAIYLDEEPWRSLKEQILGGGDKVILDILCLKCLWDI